MRNHEAEVRRTRVAIVGGGAAGVITAVHLLRAADAEHPVEVHLVERAVDAGPGLAYRTPHQRHTLNNFAARLSAIDGDPDHLLRWCAARGHAIAPTGFLRRRLYGDYLADVLHTVDVPAGSALSRTRAGVHDLTREGDVLRLTLSGDWSVRADAVVLALGNPPPRRWPALEARGEQYVADPWAPDLVGRVGDTDEVLLLGTGLTMVDAVAELHEALPMARFTAVSRTGRLPSAHLRASLRLHDTYHPGIAPLAVLRRRVTARIEELAEVGGDWRDVIDSVRASANDLWQGLSPEDQDAFVATTAREWELARHRMAPDVADLVERLRHAGRLRILRVGEVDPARFARVVNCTGPAPFPTRGWNPLVDRLLDTGTVRAHRLGLGLDLDADGRVVGASGRTDPGVYAVGAARKGLEWEVTAVPDLRSQAARLVAHLRAQREAGSPGAERAGTA